MCRHQLRSKRRGGADLGDGIGVPSRAGGKVKKEEKSSRAGRRCLVRIYKFTHVRSRPWDPTQLSSVSLER